MISRNTWVLLIILVVLIAAAVLLPRLQSNAQQPTPTIEASLPLLTADQQKAVEVNLSSADGKVLTVKNTAAGQWAVVDPSGLAFNQDKVNTAINGLLAAVILNRLPTQPPADAIGLIQPADTIQVKLENGSTLTIKVGVRSSTGSGYYVQVESNPAVIVNRGVIDNLTDLFTAGTPPASLTASPAIATATP